MQEKAVAAALEGDASVLRVDVTGAHAFECVVYSTRHLIALHTSSTANQASPSSACVDVAPHTCTPC